MLLWILFAVLTAASLSAVLSPLFREHTENETREIYDVAVYKDQLKELERDVERGLISEQEAHTAKTEISRRLIAASEKSEKNTQSSSDHAVPPKAAIATSLVLIPAFSLALYVAFGTPNPPTESRCLQLTGRFKPSKELEHVKGLIYKVEQRLRAKPDEAQGWQAIAPIYIKLHCYHDAVYAYKKTIDLLGPSGGRLSEYGEALVRASNGKVTPLAQQIFREALKLEPKRLLPKVRLTIALEQENKKQQAARAWIEIYNSKESTPQLKQMALKRVQDLTGARLAKNNTKQSNTEQRNPEQSNTEQSRQPGNPTSEDIKAASELSSGDRTAMIQNMVDGLAQRLSEDGGSLAEWKRLIQSYKVLGKKDLALKALKDAKENLKSSKEAATELDTFAKELGLTS